MRSAILLTAALATLVLASGAPAWSGTASRAWVSGHGVDQAGCGAPASPCRSLQYAHDNIIAAGGEIDILDPAGYGAITITKAVSIVNDGVGTAGVQTASGNAITINAGASDSVFLRGLNIDGTANAGVSGIRLNSAGSLTVVDCVVRHFSSSGVFLAPTSGAPAIVVSNTIAADNGQFGIAYEPTGGTATATLVIDQSIAANDAEGVFVLTPASGTTNITITDTVASNDPGEGLDLESNGGASVVKVDGSYMDHNQVGLNRIGPVTVHLSRSVIDQNSEFGIDNVTGAGGIFSSHDNHIDANATAIVGDALLSDTLK